MTRTAVERAWIAVGLFITAVALAAATWQATLSRWPDVTVCLMSAMLTGFMTFVIIEDTA